MVLGVYLGGVGGVGGVPGWCWGCTWVVLGAYLGGCSLVTFLPDRPKQASPRMQRAARLETRVSEDTTTSAFAGKQSFGTTRIVPCTGRRLCCGIHRPGTLVCFVCCPSHLPSTLLIAVCSSPGIPLSRQSQRDVSSPTPPSQISRGGNAGSSPSRTPAVVWCVCIWCVCVCVVCVWWVW